MCMYVVVLVAAAMGFGVSGETPNVANTPASKAARVVADAFRNEAERAVSAACHAVAPPPEVAYHAAARALSARLNCGKVAGVLNPASPGPSANGNAAPPLARLAAAASNVFRMYLYIESRVTNGARSVALSLISTIPPRVSLVPMISISEADSIVCARPSAAALPAAVCEVLPLTVFLKL